THSEHHGAGSRAFDQFGRIVPESTTGLGHELIRLGRRHDQDTVPALGQLAGNPGYVVVDLARRLPGVRGHLGDREAVWHRLIMRPRPGGGVTVQPLAALALA